MPTRWKSIVEWTLSPSTTAVTFLTLIPGKGAQPALVTYPLWRDLEELFQRASEIDNIVLNYLREVERVMQYPPKAFRSCRGIMTLEKNTAVTVWLRLAHVRIRNCNTDTRPCEVLELGEDVISFLMRTEKYSPTWLPRFHWPTKIYVDVNITKKTNNKTIIYGSKQ